MCSANLGITLLCATESEGECLRPFGSRLTLFSVTRILQRS
jgi:hypothetical protein